MKLNEIIREKRKDLNLTQEQVAEYLGVSAPAVNKWEKGVSCPDIMLLAPLARLLEIDMNTLFAFEEELSPGEVGIFCDEIYKVFSEEGFEAGYEKLMERVREYPKCGLLIYNLSAFLEGALMMWPPQDEEKIQGYKEKAEELLERVAESDGGEPNVRAGALNMLVANCLQKEDFEKAEELLNRIPERGVDKRPMLVSLYRNQKKEEEAVRLAQQMLYEAATTLQNGLIALMEIAKEQGDVEEATYLAEKLRNVIELLEMWDYTKYMADMEVAVMSHNAEGTVQALGKILEAMNRRWKPEESRMYKHIKKEASQDKDAGNQGEMMERMRSLLLEEMKNSEELAFVREREDFKQMLTDIS